MEFDIEQIDILIKLKSYLRMGGYPEEEKEIDYILCQYDKWISFLSEVSNMFQKLLSQMETQIKNLPISSFGLPVKRK